MMETVQQHIDAHLRHLQSLNYSPVGLRTRRFILRRFARWLAAAGVHKPGMLRVRHLENWLDALSSRINAGDRPVKARTVNKDIEVVRGFIKRLVRQGVAPSVLFDTLVYVRQPRMLPGSVLTHAQARRLLDSIPTNTADGYRNRTMLELLYSSGVRASELLGLNLSDLNIPERTAVVMGKGRKQRVVPYGKTVARMLEVYIRAIRPHFLSRASQTALFVDQNGKRLPYYSLRRIVHASREASGLDIVVTPHTFRRSCTTELLRSGANMYHVKELLGHEGLDTLKHYAKLTIIDLKQTHARCHPGERGQ